MGFHADQQLQESLKLPLVRSLGQNCHVFLGGQEEMAGEEVEMAASHGAPLSLPLPPLPAFPSYPSDDGLLNKPLCQLLNKPLCQLDELLKQKTVPKAHIRKASHYFSSCC